jgi:hypothetical protein
MANHRSDDHTQPRLHAEPLADDQTGGRADQGSEQCDDCRAVARAGQPEDQTDHESGGPNAQQHRRRQTGQERFRSQQ